MPEHDLIDQRLREYADRWRDSAAPPPAPAVHRLMPRRSRRAWWLTAASAAAVAAVIVGATQLVGDDHNRPEPPGPAETVKPADIVPWADLAPTYPKIPTRTTPASPDPADVTGKPECRASDLHATRLLEGAMGTSYLTVRLTLVGEDPCRLTGYPDVQLLDQGRPVDIPVEHRADDGVHHDPVLVAAGQPATVQLGWSSNWCTTPVHNDTIGFVLPGGSVTFPGFGDSPVCNGIAGSGPTPIVVGTFSPVKTRHAAVTSVYADVDAAGNLDLTASADAGVDFTVTLTSPQRLVLTPCPDYRIVVTGDHRPVTEMHALNCEAVPYKDADGRPYLPAGTPVHFAMHATSPGTAGLYKLSWQLDTVDARSTGGTLTVTSR